MRSTWQIQEAKNRFSEVVDLALEKGAQTITRHGKAVVVMLSVEDYAEINPESKATLLDWLKSCPGRELADLIPERSKEEVRSIELE